eukprot:CAMPEP_0185748952 /NCGR_PEP_ID=MMETSP1174-20130828/7687_1 /TAXON_ID=35687 /ORGANISM="Dictyocha speculum, Strain CCMP1381" /LENGTH=275 /DNA_ID=CAMNT_0028424869 /DNA_START=35 /DNA_END=859 /DNA_ORIENTATION=+
MDLDLRRPEVKIHRKPEVKNLRIPETFSIAAMATRSSSDSENSTESFYDLGRGEQQIPNNSEIIAMVQANQQDVQELKGKNERLEEICNVQETEIRSLRESLVCMRNNEEKAAADESNNEEKVETTIEEEKCMEREDMREPATSFGGTPEAWMTRPADRTALRAGLGPSTGTQRRPTASSNVQQPRPARKSDENTGPQIHAQGSSPVVENLINSFTDLGLTNVNRSTHATLSSGERVYGPGWSENGRKYTSKHGRTFDTTSPPPGKCFNCGGNHW